MNIKKLTASMMLACSLALASSTGMASGQSDAEMIAKYVRTQADVDKLKAFNAGVAKIDAQHRAQVDAISARMQALETKDLYSGASLVSAPAIATTRASLAQLSVHVMDNVAGIHGVAQKAERYIASAPLHKEVRNILKAGFLKAIAIKIKDTERNAAALQEFYAALENRLDFAESRLGQISVNDADQLVFANPQVQAEFDTFQEAASRAHKGVSESFAANGTGK